MKRISTATKSVDKFGVGKHGFTNGNAVTGIPATDLEDSWFDSVQEELCAIIEAAGLALDGSNRGQLLAALRSAGAFQTPALFDASTKVATMEALQRALGNLRSQFFFTASQVLDATHAGAVIEFSGVNLTCTVPATNSMPKGVGYWIFNNSSTNLTINRTGTDIFEAGNGTTITSLTLKYGESLFIASNGGTKWLVIGGSGQLPISPQFGASKASNGYQKLPSGLILQWAYVTTSTSGDVMLGFPIAFPNGVLSVTATYQNDSGSNPVIAAIGAVVATGCGVSAFNPSTSARVGAQIRVVAIGY